LLRYTQILTPTTTLGNLYSQQFRGNSVYDPDLTGAGAQPSYFDNWANMYNSYVVLSSRIVLESMITSGTNPVMVGVFPAYNTSVPSTQLDCASMRYARSRSNVAVGNAYKVLIPSSMSTAQMFGIPTEAVVMDDLYSAIVSTNPASAQTWYWTVFAQAETGTTTLSGVIRVCIEYDVKFFDPAVVNQSLTAGASTGAAAAAASPAVAPNPPSYALPCCAARGHLCPVAGVTPM